MTSYYCGVADETAAMFSSNEGGWSKSHNIEVSSLVRSSDGGANIDKFFEDVEGVKEELKEVERLHHSLHEDNEVGKTLHAASARAQMDSDVSLALKKAKLIKLNLESLDRVDTANRSVPCYGPDSSTDRTRSSVVVGLRKKLKDTMDVFSGLRTVIESDYHEAVARRYYIVTRMNY